MLKAQVSVRRFMYGHAAVVRIGGAPAFTVRDLTAAPQADPAGPPAYHYSVLSAAARGAWDAFLAASPGLSSDVLSHYLYEEVLRRQKLASLARAWTVFRDSPADDWRLLRVALSDAVRAELSSEVPATEFAADFDLSDVVRLEPGRRPRGVYECAHWPDG